MVTTTSIPKGLVLRPKKKPTGKRYTKQNPDEHRGRKRLNENSPLTRKQEKFVKELVSRPFQISLDVRTQNFQLHI